MSTDKHAQPALFMIEELETVVAPMSEAANDFWLGFAAGFGVAILCCGGA